MLDGDFERAWTISDAVMRQRARQSCAELPYHLRWVWDGAAFCGRNVLVRCYHGLGDTLQFIRFVPTLAAMARSVMVEAQPALLPLLSSVRGISALYPLGAAIPTYEVAIESMELPHALRISLDELPGPIPYLALPRAATGLAVTTRSSPRRLRVGIVWAAGDWRRERSLAPALLMPIARLPLDLVCLQLGPARHDPSAAALLRVIASAVPEHATIIETAALISGLDLIITVDTMVAHLAGALGRPVWILLDADADWRWMRYRVDSPWYPTMRLFRQTLPGEWASVVDRLTAALLETALQADAEQDQCRLVERMIAFNDGVGDGGAYLSRSANFDRSRRDP
ncbi:MAG: glycosyltransferase family 9 protein [Stellaceae bacterium]